MGQRNRMAEGQESPILNPQLRRSTAQGQRCQPWGLQSMGELKASDGGACVLLFQVRDGLGSAGRAGRGAISAGVPTRRVAELTGISRATVARWGKDVEQ